jgi:hypothetical protein
MQSSDQALTVSRWIAIIYVQGVKLKITRTVASSGDESPDNKNISCATESVIITKHAVWFAK